MPKTKLTTKIKEYRLAKNLTQESFADLAGGRRETIVFVEQGKYVPSLKLAHDIAKVLGARIDELFFFG
jgi:putative transcriptional regulator